MGVIKDKIKELGIFDYLDPKNSHAKTGLTKNVVIAGNLSLEKSAYLSSLKKHQDVDFNLYGINFKDSCKGENVHYQGAFKPDELADNLEGSFGLIWDGDSDETCAGLYGNYLRYNNPHKTSLYLSAGLPVIIWEDAALADFVLKNHVGLTIKSLDEISEKRKQISKLEYENMLKNVEKIAKRLKTGAYLKEALEKAGK
jgi:hypothetical protein